MHELILFYLLLLQLVRDIINGVC